MLALLPTIYQIRCPTGGPVYPLAADQEKQIGPDNVFALNGHHGVWIGSTDAAAIENTITQNAIYGHPYEGIQLIAGGNLEFFAPILTDVTANTVSGLASPNSTIEIFSDDVTKGAPTKARPRRTQMATSATAGRAIHAPNVTATATDANGNTSGFSGAYEPRGSMSPPCAV